MPYPNQPKDTPIPPELDRWNWGAFFLNWIWGLGNGTYIALLMFVPVVNFFMIFVLGAKGSKWAWKNRLWTDEAHFIKTQRNWARAGVLVWIGFIFLFAAMFFGISSLMKNSDAYKISMAELRSSSEVAEVLGKPVTVGWFVSGNISIEGAEGKAQLSIPVSGPICSGTAISYADKEFGSWNVYLLLLRAECEIKPIILINEKNLRIPGNGNTPTAESARLVFVPGRDP